MQRELTLMKLRAKLILSFLGLAVVPLATITLYSYHSSRRALRTAVEQESSAMASDMSSRMESVSKDINRQIERLAVFEFGRIMTLDKKDRTAAMTALESRLKNLLGDNASFLKSLKFTPVALPPAPPPFLPRPKIDAKISGAIGDMPKNVIINFSGGPGGPGAGSPENNRWPSLPPFPRGQFSTEVRNGNELLGNVSTEISSQRLLFHVLMRTQARQGEIPFAIDSKGKIYATNPNDAKTIQSLSPHPPLEKDDEPQQVSTTKNWILVTRKDSQSGLSFGIARPIGDRLGDLRLTAVRNMGYGLGIVAIALVGIIPLSGRMTLNLSVLTSEAEKLARGNLAARVRVTSKDEFGKLADTFNRMAQDLSENQKHLIEQERMRKELEMCRKIQEELLPRQPLRFGSVEVKGVSIPAREVGGDFFNYFKLSSSNMALLIGDVSGKGLPAAMLMANLQATIQARLPLELDLVKLAEQLDREIAANNAEAYLTLFIAVLDSQSLKLRYVNAGHNPQFLLHSDGSLEQLWSTGRPIGLLAGGGYQEEKISLKNADSLFFYTDGLVETTNEVGEEFGMERLQALLVEERTRGFDKMLADVERAVSQYRGNVEAADDATMMLLKIGDLS
jgi:serine phosphatase RsbU (regulator of sigma subunit)